MSSNLSLCVTVVVAVVWYVFCGGMSVLYFSGIGLYLFGLFHGLIRGRFIYQETSKREASSALGNPIS
ncbi:MAG: hypothetical protein G01um101420_936 [Parcubacteria group bacterium Gr01-1014_20]|nr:MAG: hypothetical protein G01um101420_936 [Parcubacteria group bacterium Gr01-1014_20]